MTSRDHDNRSDKQKGQDDGPSRGTQGEGHQSPQSEESRNDGTSSQNGGGDGAGGAPRQQGQGQANKDAGTRQQNRGHG